jgi:hypothetical protein
LDVHPGEYRKLSTDEVAKLKLLTRPVRRK